MFLEEISDVTGNDLLMTGVTEMYLVPVVRSNHPLLMPTNKSPLTSPQLNGIQTQVIFLYYC